MDMWRQGGNNQKIELMDIPDVSTLKEWQLHTIRVVAQAPPACESRAAQKWIMAAMNPEVPREDLIDAGRFTRIDFMIATCLLEKFAKL